MVNNVEDSGHPCFIPDLYAFPCSLINFCPCVNMQALTSLNYVVMQLFVLHHTPQLIGMPSSLTN
jgi:hypothetical protein